MAEAPSNELPLIYFWMIRLESSHSAAEPELVNQRWRYAPDLKR
jgi:hypothetical protein